MKTMTRLRGCVCALLVAVPMLAMAQDGAAVGNPVKYGALAVDEAHGFFYGFAHDYESRAQAEQIATQGCTGHGGESCAVVLSWSGEGCGAYRSTHPQGARAAYGWGLAATQGEADRIAAAELRKRTSDSALANHAWACNASGTGPFDVLMEKAVPASASGPVRLVNDEGEEYEYEGPLVDGLPNGKGTARFIKSGDRYTGDFVAGKAVGQGVYEWASGARYEGPWVNDHMEGEGHYRFREGSTYVGSFKAGKLEGYGRKYDVNGNLEFEGAWHDNKRVQ